jgi:hypothetical protein
VAEDDTLQHISVGQHPTPASKKASRMLIPLLTLLHCLVLSNHLFSNQRVDFVDAMFFFSLLREDSML